MQRGEGCQEHPRRARLIQGGEILPFRARVIFLQLGRHSGASGVGACRLPCIRRPDCAGEGAI